MVSKQTVQVLIEAQENVSKVAKKAEDAIKKMGNTGQNGLSKLSSIAGRVSSGFNKLTSWVSKARDKFNAFTSSSNKLGMIKSAITGAAGSFGQLINNSNLASRAMEKIKSVSEGIQSKFTSLQSKITGFGSSVKTSLTNAFNISNIKSKLTSLGGSIDKLKAKFKSLAAEAKKTGGGGGLGFLSNAASMTVGMLGYDLVGSIMETTRASLNARSSMQAFANRLQMNASEVSAYQKSLDDLQNTFKKVDMDVVGQQATDMAFRLGLPKTSLTELTETTAIFTDAMQRNGRSAEESMLAMSDAMDGQFVRLKEIGISREDLMNDGWSGDINDKTGLLKAMNKALKDQHYDELAKSVDTLDEAWQVLSVTLGNLVEAILLPLTPVIVGIINGLMDAVNGIKGFVSMLQSAFNGLPDWAKYGIAIAAIAVGVAVAIAAFGGLEAILLSVAAALAPVIATIGAISLPIIAVVAAIGLLVAAIFEVGKAFGWWTDVGSMFEHIGAGIQRMWNAFINHPDVQAAIAAITGALQWLAGAIGNAFNAILEFFGVSSSSNFDIVRALIDGIGFAWQATTAPIRIVIGLVQALAGAFGNFYSGTLVPLGEFLYSLFAPVWTTLMTIFTAVVEYVTSLVTIFQQFQDGQISLSTMLTMIWNSLLTMFSTIFSSIGLVVFNFINTLTNGALTAGMNFVNGVVNWLMQLPGRVWTWLVQTSTRISTAGQKWVSTARSKANQVVSGVISYLKSLPGKAYSALLGVVSRIISAGGQWVSAAKGKASDLVSSVVNTLSSLPGKIGSALAGVVNAVTKPFQDAYNKAKEYADKIASLVPSFGGDAYGGEPAYGTDLPSVNVTGNSSNPIEYTSIEDNSPIVIEDNINLNIDFSNVPSNINTTQLIEALHDKNVLEALVNNRNFQDLDAKVKQRINLKTNRARGI